MTMAVNHVRLAVSLQKRAAVDHGHRFVVRKGVIMVEKSVVSKVIVA